MNENIIRKKNLTLYAGTKAYYRAKIYSRSGLINIFGQQIETTPIFDEEIQRSLAPHEKTRINRALRFLLIDNDLGSPFARVCYGSYLHYVGKCTRSFIKVFLPEIFYSTESVDRNFVWMNVNELGEYLNYLRLSLGLDFYFNIVKGKNKVAYEVNIDTKSLRKIEIKLVLFWLRYAFEFPGNMIVYDALKLKEKYPEEELYNLIIVPTRYLSSCDEFPIPLPPDQCITRCGAFLTKDVLKDRLSKRSSVTSLFSMPKEKGIRFGINQKLNDYFKLSGEPLATSWLDNTDRWEAYDNIYQRLKENEISEIQ